MASRTLLLGPVLLASGLCAPLRAAPPSPPPALEDEASAEGALRQMNADLARHSADLDELDSLLARYRDLGRPPAAGAADALARRERVWAAYGPLIYDANLLCDREYEYEKAIKIAALAHPGDLRRRRPSAFSAMAFRAMTLGSQHSALCRRNDELIAGFESERRASDPGLREAVTREERLLRARRTIPWALGAAAAAIAAGLGAYLRRR